MKELIVDCDYVPYNDVLIAELSIMSSTKQYLKSLY